MSTEKLPHFGNIGVRICVCEVRVDPVNRVCVGPAALSHGGRLAPSEVVREGGEAVPESMHPHLRQTLFLAKLVD